MKFLLRKIRLNRWLNKPTPLSEEHVQELLRELVPTNNRLSVYMVENDADTETAITGLASNRKEIRHVRK